MGDWLIFPNHSKLSFKLGIGSETKNHIESHAILSLLDLAREYGINYLYIFKDSMEIIAWWLGDSHDILDYNMKLELGL